ncbi:Peptidoglycan-associated lipoprotein [Sinobacterium norvegicum]|uniref:Peptidoglycan-associated lipoprotein n=1 Tax=Sinobacterium norvegicum TaxID=1641715 RepID=A0ABM9A9U6_9GAMM|nr:OmpA family protein [Sinobacterium norvegicum]CAH0990025.1 Peptidoglycan-associated lipoprotein [Sinobacterium norvegicum]
MKMHSQGLTAATILLLITACSATAPDDQRMDRFGSGLPEGDVEQLTAEYEADSLVLKDNGIGDKDGDAIIDKRDACDEVTEADIAKDNSGCSKTLSEVKTVDLTIEFASASTTVDRQYFEELGRLAELYQTNPGQKILVEGHTDATGSRQQNTVLSMDRAKSVAGILISDYGVNSEDILVSGFGPDKPIATNKTAEGRQQNRRMVAHLVYEDRVVKHQWNIWSVELGDKQSEIQQYYTLLEAE